MKDEDYNSETGEYNLVSICTAKNGKPVDDTGDIHISELFAELCRINNYQNLTLLQQTASSRLVFEIVINMFANIKNEIGGTVVYLECLPNEKLMNFYISNWSQLFGERISDSDEKYFQYMLLL